MSISFNNLHLQCTILSMVLLIPVLKAYNTDILERDVSLIRSIVTSSQLSDCTLIFWTSKAEPASYSEDCYPVILTLTKSSMYFRNATLSSLTIPTFMPRLHEHCSIILYYYLWNFNNPTIYPTNWVNTLPGGHLRTYHVIFHSIKKATDISKFTPSPRPIRMMRNQLFVISFSNSTFDLMYLDIWAQQLLFLPSGRKQKFFQGKSDFQGRPVVFAYRSGILSQERVDNYKRTRKPVNMYITPVVEFSDAINATPYLRIIKSENVGAYDRETGRWTGVIGEVIHGGAHITEGVWLTKERNDVLLLSGTIDSDGLSFITGSPTVVQASATFLFQTFEWRIWAALVILIGGLFLLLKIIKDKDNWKTVDNLSLLGYLLKSLVDQAEGSIKYGNLLQRSASRVLISPWLFGAILLGSAFKTNLISKMTQPELSYPPRDFNSLIRSDYKVNFFAKNETVAGQIFSTMKDTGNSIVLELEKRILGNYGSSNVKCLTRTQTSNEVCLGVHYLLMLKAQISLTQENGEPLFKISSNFLVSSGYVFGLHPDLPHIKENIDRMMHHYSASGTYQHFFARLSRDVNKFGKHQAKARRKRGTLYPKEMNALMASHSIKQFEIIAMFPLLLGSAIAVIAMMCELVLTWIQNMSKYQITKKTFVEPGLKIIAVVPSFNSSPKF